MVAYFVRGAGSSWAVIRLTGRTEQIVAGDLSKEATIEWCNGLLESRNCRGVLQRPWSCRSPGTLRRGDDQSN